MKVFSIILALIRIHSTHCEFTRSHLRSHTHQAAEYARSSRSELSFIKSESALVMAADQESPAELQIEHPGKHGESFQQSTHQDPPHKGLLAFLRAPPDEGKKGGEWSGGTWTTRILVQFLFGVIYYFLIVTKYPKLNGLHPTPEAIKLQSENAVSATLQSSFPNCFYSLCCSGPRAAHTFHSTGVLDYWPGCIAMSLFPCCTLWVVNSFTDLNTKLGGVKDNIFMGLICACCCSCCVIAQDAESLDMITGARTNFCGVDDENVNTREPSQRLV